MAREAALARRASKRSTAGESRAADRRWLPRSPRRPVRAGRGRSRRGFGRRKAASAAGCAENEETESGAAQQKVATPPGPGRDGPTVTAGARRSLPSACRRPPSRPARAETARPGRAGPVPAAVIRAATARATGSTASSASTAKTSIAPDITTVATAAAVSGADHRQPMGAVTIGAAETEEDGVQQAERGQAGRGRSRPVRTIRCEAAQAGVGKPGYDPAPDHVRRPRR